MLPSLASLSLHGCSGRDGCGRRPRAAVGVPLAEYEADNSAECTVCMEPLDAQSTSYPWTGDGIATQACSEGHVFHWACLALTYVAAADMRVKARCPECRRPMLDNVQDVALFNSMDAPENPYRPSALEFWEYAQYEARMAKDAASQSTLQSTHPAAVLAYGRLIQYEFYQPNDLADFIRDQDYLNETGVARYAQQLLDKMDKVAYMREAAQNPYMPDWLRDALTAVADSAMRVVSAMVQASPRLSGMVVYHTTTYRRYLLNDRAKHFIENPVEDEWDDSRRDDAMEEDSSDSEDDPDAVPGTPPGPASPRSPPRYTGPVVPATPEPPEPSPAPEDPPPTYVVVPETPPGSLSPPGGRRENSSPSAPRRRRFASLYRN